MPRKNARAIVCFFCVALLSLGGCGGGAGDDPVTAVGVPEPDMTEMEAQVARRLRETRTAVLDNPLSDEAWGRFGMVAHAHELWEEASITYQQAEKLNSKDVRWPYFLGDVLSVVGTNLPQAENAFRRAMALRPDYAPAHMRLGKVLLAKDQREQAALQFARALELEPDLQQARVPLAQVRLSQGRLEEAQSLLEEVLVAEPKHGQALSTLAQVYMRLGRRDDARATADRARDPASYNLFQDPLMAQVVAEGVSAAQLWERAKSFLEAGNSEQAVIGLRRVVEIQPKNADAHQQLAVAYGNLGDLDGARTHLSRTIALEPESASARVQMALLHLEEQRPADAVAQLRLAAELAPDDPDTAWLLGKALVAGGNATEGVRVFEDGANRGFNVPAWTHNEWGRALAQLGQPQSALDQFRAALALEPNNVQALFFSGLIFEGLGQVDDAVRYYCRAMSAEPTPPAAARLQAIGQTCG